MSTYVDICRLPFPTGSCDDVRGLAQRVSSGGDQGRAGQAPEDTERRAVRAADACIVLAKINVSVLGNLRRSKRCLFIHSPTMNAQYYNCNENE